jgi:hypothetical protein
LSGAGDGLFGGDQGGAALVYFGDAPLYFGEPGFFGLAGAGEAGEQVVGKLGSLFGGELESLLFEGIEGGGHARLTKWWGNSAFISHFRVMGTLGARLFKLGSAAPKLLLYNYLSGAYL